MAWPTRGQQAPAYWDDQLREYIDDADTLALTAATDAQGTADSAFTGATNAAAAAAAAQETADDALADATTAQTTATSAGSAASAAQTTANNAIPKTADITAIVKITQAAYDALTPKVATTLYVIVA